MTSLLIFTNKNDTPWSNPKFVGVPGFPYYNNNPLNLPTCQNDISIRLFADAMNKMNFSFSYDYAAAIFK